MPSVFSNPPRFKLMTTLWDQTGFSAACRASEALAALDFSLMSILILQKDLVKDKRESCRIPPRLAHVYDMRASVTYSL